MAQAEVAEAPASPPLCFQPANNFHEAPTHIALIAYPSLSVAGARHTMIDDNTDPGVTIEPDDRPTPAPNPMSHTERLQQAAAEWNILLNRQPIAAPTTDRTDVHLSPENLRTNIPWGDTLQPKPTNTF